MHLTVLTLAEPTCFRDLSEPLIDHAEGQLFLNEAFKIIVEEVLCNGTDINHKVWGVKNRLAITTASRVSRPPSGVPERSFSSCRFVSGRSRMISLSCWTWSWRRRESRSSACCNEWKTSPSTASRPVRLSAGRAFHPLKKHRTLTTRRVFRFRSPSFF